MRYMFLIYSREMSGERSPEALEALKNGHRAVIEDAQKKGVLLGLAGLKPTSMASTVRIDAGKPGTLDGPFAETREQLGGFFLVDAADLDEAISIAARLPAARKGTVEIRPAVELPNLP